MREMLFKAKRIDNGEWIEGYYYKRVQGNNVVDAIEKYNGNIESIEYYEINPETLCQYIGITDKNDRKIFENDIIETHTFGFDNDHFITYVKFGAKFSMQGFYLDNGRSLFYFGQSDLTKMDDTKVIGNIFDNPELVKST